MTLADEWFDEFIAKIQGSPRRRQRLWRERVVVPASVEMARLYELETEHKLRYLRQRRDAA